MAMSRDRPDREAVQDGLLRRGLVEALLITAMLLLMKFGDRLQLMLLIGFVGSYTIIVLALVALGVHMNRIGNRIIRAMEVSVSRPR
jgi:hypothetical protein